MRWTLCEEDDGNTSAPSSEFTKHVYGQARPPPHALHAAQTPPPHSIFTALGVSASIIAITDNAAQDAVMEDSGHAADDMTLTPYTLLERYMRFIEQEHDARRETRLQGQNFDYLVEININQVPAAHSRRRGSPNFTALVAVGTISYLPPSQVLLHIYEIGQRRPPTPGVPPSYRAVNNAENAPAPA
ncbi:hypothetical protein HYPSUDRAFT_208883 [Hypholoma sublateritium FD-334 SS-4]|uniref:Uncharacterized protein n=1 Tax=Hypholoma sublateritium (strain FD-334 SS-4) TaxID=945553 RepID=A0A0D2LTS9_HYPSF|nr:hypothetical protein HYPSUDRAFT_208883 [Hypholoma sublateritium FD-334 SS-4]